MNQNNIKQKFVEKLEPIIQQFMQMMQIPGLSIAITDRKQTIYSKGFGFSNKESQLEAKPETIYAIGSASKSYTALAILALVQEKKIKLSDSIEKFVPEPFKEPWKSITIHHLLTHSSGIPDLGQFTLLYGSFFNFEKLKIPYNTWEDFWNYLQDSFEFLIFSPGERMMYTNTGYTILHYIIEQVSGLNLEDYIQQRVFDKLDMHHSLYETPKTEDFSNIAAAYELPKFEQKDHICHPLMKGSGGIFSNVLDQNKFLRLYLNHGKSKLSAGFKGNTISLIEKNHQPMHLIQNVIGDLGPEFYNYGWMSFSYKRNRFNFHLGSTTLNAASNFYSQDLKYGVSILTNHGGAQIATFLLAMACFLILMDEKPMESPVFGLLQKDTWLNQFVGVYKSYKNLLTVKISRIGSFLKCNLQNILAGDDSNDIYLAPEDEQFQEPKFYNYSAPGAKVDFEFKKTENNGMYLCFGENVLKKQSSDVH